MKDQEIRIPAHYRPRPEQLAFWKAYHDGTRFFDLCWHRREGKDLTALNATVEEILTKRPGLAWHMFPTLAQGRKVLWDATDNEGRPLTSAFPKQLVTEVNKADMRIKCKFVPDIVSGADEIRESTWQVVGADNPDSLRGGNPILVVISEFGDIAPNVWYEIIQPIILANYGKAMFVWTPKGRNHAYTLHCAAQKSMMDPAEPKEFKWFSQVLTANDTTKWIDENGLEIGIPTQSMLETGKYKRVPVITKEAIDKAREQGMDEAKILQEYYCHVPETLVTTALGQVRIDEIKVGDCVLTHTGRIRKVLAKMVRPYEGDLIELHTYGNGTPLKCTPNHPIRVYNQANQTYSWVKAEDLKVGDRITFPKRNSRPAFMPDALVKLIAWYLSDGSFAKNAVTISVGAKEKNNIEELMEISKELSINVTMTASKDKSTMHIIFCSTALADFLLSLCGSPAQNKRIPFEAIGGKEELFWETLMKGDGCYALSKNKYPFISFTTVSPHLAYGVQQLSIMLGHRAGITAPRVNNSEILGRVVNTLPSYSVQIRKGNSTSKTASNKLRIAKYCMHAAIRKINKIPYKGDVYNLSVQYDESFVADGRVVHNCSFDASLKGAYFGEQMNAAAAENRISSDVLHKADMPVITAWDLGMNDTMEIIFAQCIGDAIRIIDYYSNNGKTLDHYIKYIKEKPYTYSFHFGPHDLRVRELGAGSRLEYARKLGVNFTMLPRVVNKEDSINAARSILPRCMFNIDKCSKLIEALKSYTKKWDEKRQCFCDTPLHNWASNPADAFQCLAMGLYTHPSAMRRLKLKKTEDDDYVLIKPDLSRANDDYDLFGDIR